MPLYRLPLTTFAGEPQFGEDDQGFRQGIVPALSDSMILFVISS